MKLCLNGGKPPDFDSGFMNQFQQQLVFHGKKDGSMDQMQKYI